MLQEQVVRKKCSHFHVQMSTMAQEFGERDQAASDAFFRELPIQILQELAPMVPCDGAAMSDVVTEQPLHQENENSACLLGVLRLDMRVRRNIIRHR